MNITVATGRKSREMKRRLLREIQLWKNWGGGGGEGGMPNRVTVLRVNVTKTKTSTPPAAGESGEKGDPTPMKTP